MNLSRERLLDEAQRSGFRAEILEKVMRLLSLLDGLRSHPYLKGRVALKGGTALNLFLFNVPRLSVDIDMNYVGSVDRETMLAERPYVEQAVEAVCQREGMALTRVPEDFAGGKWRLRYASALGGRGNIEVDLNFMYRIPLWPLVVHGSRQVGGTAASSFPVLDIHEIAAGKLAALFSRRASRDLFDVHALLRQEILDGPSLRTAFVAYGAMNRKDWRTISMDDIGFEGRDLRDQLLPLLRSSDAAKHDDPEAWARTLAQECMAELGRLLPFTDAEREFLDRLLDDGEIASSLLTTDESLAHRIGQHPLLAWKALNVRQHKGRS